MADTHNDVMQVNSDSVTFKNLYATYGKAALGQKSNYGNTLLIWMVFLSQDIMLHHGMCQKVCTWQMNILKQRLFGVQNRWVRC